MPIDAGAEAPDFTLPNQNNQPVSLSLFRGRSPVLIVFYPLAFTGTCQGELTEIQQSLDRFTKDSVQVLTVSVDSVYSHKVWADREGYTFPLLADFWPHGEVARAYGVFNAKRGYANRGTFLVDLAGVVRFAEELPAGQRRAVSGWLSAVELLSA